MQIRAKQEPAGPPPPPGFKKYEKSSGSGGVMGMIEQIIADAKTLEAEAIQAETDSQKASALRLAPAPRAEHYPYVPAGTSPS